MRFGDDHNLGMGSGNKASTQQVLPTDIGDLDGGRRTHLGRVDTTSHVHNVAVSVNVL